MAFDISDFNNSKSATLHVRHPGTNEPLYDEEDNPVEIELAGKDHPRYINAEHEISNRRIQQGLIKRTSEDILSDNYEICALCTLDWKNLAVGGEVPECNKREAMNLYRKEKWLYEQVYNFIHERSHFFKKG